MPTAPPTPDPLPLLSGVRARAGVTALADRVRRDGRPARVFGHPARLPANRDALAAAVLATLAALLGWPFPDAGLWFAGVGFLVVGVAAAGGALWPRRAAWTLIVGTPGPAVREIVVLALDRRRVRRPYLAVAALPAAAVLLAPGEAWPAGLGAIACAVCAIDGVGPRAITLDAAAAWVERHAAGPERLCLVTTAGSARGEGVAAVVDWFHLAGAELMIKLDEDGESGALAELARAGIGPAPKGGPDVVVDGRAGG